MRASQTSLGGDEQERELKAQPKSILRGAPAAMACYLACI
jgi:hypothetical protein